MRVLVVAEYYPRLRDEVRGIWAHKQALAAREAGAEVRALVLHRPLPPLMAIRQRDAGAISAALAQPGDAQLDGVDVEYLRYVSPPRPWSYPSWGAWAAPALALRLRTLRREFPFDLIHAHYAVPAGDAIRRAAPHAPLVVSVHGHDVYGPLIGHRAVQRTLAHASMVLANSRGTAQRSAASGARMPRVIHLGTDLPPAPRSRPAQPTLVTVAQLAARKRHVDVLEALALLAPKHPDLRYVLVGDGPERHSLEDRAESLGVRERVHFRGQLAPREALATARSASLFVMPSVEEAFGVAYVEAMAAGVPAIGTRGEAGPEEIAAAGAGITLVPPGDSRALAGEIDRLLDDADELSRAADCARRTVEREFTWTRCGKETVRAYRDALSAGAR